MGELTELLHLIEANPVSFAMDGVIDNPPIPCLQIEDIEDPIAFPLCKRQALEIISIVNQTSVKPHPDRKRYSSFYLGFFMVFTCLIMIIMPIFHCFLKKR